MADKVKSQSEAELEWIQMVSDMDSLPKAETTKEKFIRKFYSNPFVPVGCLLTAGALTVGLYNFRTGNRQMSQYMMRARIAAQGFTVVALIVGVLAAVKN